MTTILSSQNFKMFKKPSLELLKLEFLGRLVLLIVILMSLFRPFLAFIQGRYYPFDYISPAILIILLSIYSVFFFSVRLHALSYYSIPLKNRSKILFKTSLTWLALVLWLVFSLFLTAFLLRNQLNYLDDVLRAGFFLISFGAMVIFNPLNLTLNLARSVYAFNLSSQAGRFWILLRAGYIFMFLTIFFWLVVNSNSIRLFSLAEDFFVLLNLVYFILILDVVLIYFENAFLTKNKNWLQDI